MVAPYTSSGAAYLVTVPTPTSDNRLAVLENEVAGETISDTLARVLEREPAWERLLTSTPLHRVQRGPATVSPRTQRAGRRSDSGD